MVEEQVIGILSKNLGKYKDNGNGWYSFNCPNCSFIAGKKYDNKFNLECHIKNRDFFYHCWACSETHGTKGDLIKLIRLFSKEDYNYYVDLIKNYVDYSRLEPKRYSHIGQRSIEYPKGCKRYDNRCQNYAQKYLIDRGLTEDIIQKFNIFYTTQDLVTPIKYWDRIVIPSFDSMGVLNYMVCRSYNPNNPVKYLNSDVEKKDIIFNEFHLDYNDDIVLVEGVFDHFVVPNSVPMLGKILTPDMLLFKRLCKFSTKDIIIFLDGDAYVDAIKIYKLLDSNVRLMGRVKLVKIDDKTLDPSEIYQKMGKEGIESYIKSAKKINEFELMRV